MTSARDVHALRRYAVAQAVAGGVPSAVPCALKKDFPFE